MKKITSLFILLTISLAAFNASAQNDLTLPETSQKASVMQRLGLTDIKVDYHSPLVKGRPIWGELVPFGEVWRAGANENTVISFSTDVKIEGKALSAGVYGLHMIPSKDSWVIIFSKNYYSWGSYFYKQSDDGLRVTVTPEATAMQEWLSYRFTDIKANSAKVEMHWEKVAVSFFVEVNVPETVVSNMRKELNSMPGFSWEGPYQAANYCFQNNIYEADAWKWLDQSIATKETFQNLALKSKMFAKQNKLKESDEYMQKALSVADEAQLNAYGYQLMGQNKTAEAIDIFRKNVKKYPNSWNVYDSLAETLEQTGDHKGAIANYKLAMAKAPEIQKKRISEILKKLEK